MRATDEEEEDRDANKRRTNADMKEKIKPGFPLLFPHQKTVKEEDRRGNADEVTRWTGKQRLRRKKSNERGRKTEGKKVTWGSLAGLLW